MDVTPTPKMLEAMKAFTNVLVGEEPLKVETTPAANKLRNDRRRVMDWLHNFCRLSMREGVRRDREARKMPTMEDPIRPNPLNG